MSKSFKKQLHTIAWSPAPFIYSTLTEKVTCAIRKWTIAPLLTWILYYNWGANSVSSQNDSKWGQLTSAKRVDVL